MIHKLAAVKDVLTAFQLSASLQRKCIRARARLAKGIGADNLGGHLRQIAFLLFFAAPAQQRVIDQGILHVDDHAGGSVHARQFFHCQDRLKELGSASPVLFGNLNSHQSELEEIVDEIFIEDALLIHLLHQRTNLLVGKLANVIAEKNFIFGKVRERRGSSGLQRGFGHERTFQRSGWQTDDFSTAATGSPAGEHRDCDEKAVSPPRRGNKPPRLAKLLPPRKRVILLRQCANVSSATTRQTQGSTCGRSGP